MLVPVDGDPACGNQFFDPKGLFYSILWNTAYKSVSTGRILTMEQNKAKTTGLVHSIESFGLVDGPGVRFIVFLQGCHMRCKYCHNPETWQLAGCGEERTAEDVFKQAYRYRNYWRKNGGMTVSGGEPLLQMDFVTELFRLAKQKKIHTTIDTAGQPFNQDDPEFMEKFNKLMELTDLYMLDIKEIDPEKHKALTGHDNSNILAMAKYLSDNGKDMWIRHVLVPDLTDDVDGLKEIADFIDTLKTVTRVEILPYHTLGLFKWENLGIKYPLEGVVPPTEEQTKLANELLHTERYV